MSLGNLSSSYIVEDKKQAADFDSAAFIDDDDDPPSCPICDSTDNEDVLLLCDACDVPYHTYCVGLDRVPRGHWFCMECVGNSAESRSADPLRVHRELQRDRRQPRTFAQRTLAQVRQHRARTDAWHGSWNQISGRVYDALNLDLDYDNYDDDDELLEGGSLRGYRTHQQRATREREEFQRWQQRLRIASHQGAHDIFRHATRPIREQLQPQRQNPEELKAWDAFEKVRESGLNGSLTGKRKTRSDSHSPVEPATTEPERKLKRPRTRRVIDKAGSPTDGNTSSRRNSGAHMSMTPQRSTGSAADANVPPSFLSSLLKEVEMSTTTDDENSHLPYKRCGASYSACHSSPVISPSSSNYSTPRAMSATPPPFSIQRPGSPLPLTSHVEPIFPPADYTSSRLHLDCNNHGDRLQATAQSLTELRQPRPRRKQLHSPSSQATSPTRANLSREAKDGISKIVRTALDPHYKKPSGITKEQYGNINREVSRMLYDRIPDPTNLDEDARSVWEKIAAVEVAKAVEGLKA